MLEIILLFLFFVISLAVLMVAADYFVKFSEKIGLYFNVPPFIIGVTILAIGTSLPELSSSIMAVFSGASEIVISDVVGSNITNIFLGLGLVALLGKKIKMDYEITHVDMPLLLSSVFLLGITMIDGVFSLFDGLLCLSGLIIYFVYSSSVDKAHKKELEEKAGLSGVIHEKKKLSLGVWIGLFVSAGMIYIGAKYTIDSLIMISKSLNIGRDIVAMSALAIGTSLPEIVF